MGGNVLKDNNLIIKAEAKTVAERIRQSGEWVLSDCEKLCELADLSEEWESADGETFESILFKAADHLGVEIV